jgi:hypothetical protein
MAERRRAKARPRSTSAGCRVGSVAFCPPVSVGSFLLFTDRLPFFPSNQRLRFPECSKFSGIRFQWEPITDDGRLRTVPQFADSGGGSHNGMHVVAGKALSVGVLEPRDNFGAGSETCTSEV